MGPDRDRRPAGARDQVPRCSRGRPRGTDATVAACTGAATQRWTIGSDGVVVNEGTGLVLDVFGKRTADGSAVGIWPRNGGTNQEWQWR